MSSTGPPIRDISDTARWAALYRARESERPGGLFRDPWARRLAGERGERIDAALPFSKRHTWSWVTRTVLFDDFISQEVARGADLVVNLAAGLDARPYRMALPPALRWVEVDLPDLVAYKEEVLRDEKPACSLRRVPLDLADVAARRALFAELGGGAERALVVSEGLTSTSPPRRSAPWRGTSPPRPASGGGSPTWSLPASSSCCKRSWGRSSTKRAPRSSSPPRRGRNSSPGTAGGPWRCAPCSTPPPAWGGYRSGCGSSPYSRPRRRPVPAPGRGSASSKKSRLEPPGGEAFGPVLGYNPRIEITGRAARVGELS